MNGFNLRTVLISLSIVAALGIAVMLVDKTTGKKEPVSSSTQQADKAPAARVKKIPGDERDGTGILQREEHYDIDDIKRELHARFLDGTVAVVYYDQFGRMSKIKETSSTGDYQVFFFDLKSKKINKIQAFRKDNSLRREAQPASNKTSFSITFFAKDGKTPVCNQLMNKDNSFEVVIFHEDGKTPKAVYKSDADQVSAELKTYNEKGVLKIEEKIEQSEDFEDEDDEGGGYVELLTITGYRDDGTAWYTTQRKASFYPGEEIPPVTEFHADGKTVSRIVHNTAGPEHEGPEEDRETQMVEIHDQNGKLVQRRTLRFDFSVITEENIDDEGEVSSTKSYKPGELIDEGAKSVTTEFNEERDMRYLEQYITPVPVEPNHLRQTLAPY